METTYESPLGRITIEATAEGVTAVDFVDTNIDKNDVIKLEITHKKHLLGSRAALEQSDELLAKTIKQLDEYFAHKRTTFDVPLDLHGTPFQQQVWRALQDVPYGKTVTYKDIGIAIKNPKAVRAIGQANGRNPVCIIVPCHRVVASDGLGGYSSGIARKEWLLEHEKLFLH